MTKGPINPQDGLKPGDYVEPPLGKPKTSVLPDIEALGIFAGESVAKLRAEDAREVRLILQKCLTKASYERYKSLSECPVNSRATEVRSDIRLLIEVLHQQGPADMVTIDKITNALRLGLTVEAIGDQFAIPVNRLKTPDSLISPVGLSDDMLKLLAAALVIQSKSLDGHTVLTRLAGAFSAQQAHEIVGSIK